jgi:thioredoxin 1
MDFRGGQTISCHTKSKKNAPKVANELPEGKHVGKLNIETYQSMAQKFNVRSIPTLILFKDGKEVDRFVGVKSKDFLLKAMK